MTLTFPAEATGLDDAVEMSDVRISVLHEFRSSILGELTRIEPDETALERERRERDRS